MSTTMVNNMNTEEHTASPPKAARSRSTYWTENLKLLGGLLTIWFIVSFGFGVILRDALDHFSILGVPAGFWFAQQGSIYVFIVLIFAYSRLITKIERKHGVSDDEEEGQS